MGPADLSGPYAYNAPSYAHLQDVFRAMFGTAPGAALTPSPRPTATETPVETSLVLTTPELAVRAAGGTTRPLAPAPVLHPDLSPDGRWIAFAAPYAGTLDLYRVPTSGGSPERLTTASARETHPVWLPDGRRLLYVSERGGVPALWRLDLATGESHPLDDLPAPASWPAVTRKALCCTAAQQYSAPDDAATADSVTLAFAAAPAGAWNLYAVALDRRGEVRPETLVQLTHAPGLDLAPAWAPDGTTLAFASDRGSTLALYRRSADGRVEALTTAGGWAPRWLPDGRLVYHAYDETGMGIWLLDPERGASRKIVTGPGVAWPVPQP